MHYERSKQTVTPPEWSVDGQLNRLETVASIPYLCMIVQGFVTSASLPINFITCLENQEKTLVFLGNLRF